MLHRHSRLSQTGGTHFVTTVTQERGNWFVEPSACQEILKSLEHARQRFGIVCVGYILMPDHLHALLHQPEENEGVTRMMRSFKSYTSRFLKPDGYPDGPLWRTYYDDVPVPGSEAALAKLGYLHNNPVRRSIVTKPETYRWSSIHEYCESGRGIVTVCRMDGLGSFETLPAC
jgi:putative transposase